MHPIPWRIAILSDPHGDLVALRKVIADLESLDPVDEVLVGGDLAQGGAQPAEVVDLIRERDWSAVRGNADDLLVRLADGWTPEEALRPAGVTHDSLPESVAEHALWSVDRLGSERIEYLRNLPLSIVRGFAFGSMALVHATPWSTEDVVLPDAEEEIAKRMVREAGARLLVYGHIHTQYIRRVGDATLMSVGAINGSNDADPRPAYAILDLGETITVQPRRVDWPLHERRAAYAAAGVERRFSRDAPGPFPVRCQPGVAVTVWP
ncbi:MAG: metallophosphoesterase family protein [Chloroflexi bacterium]|nr:metallophosphoesterase family protein [Chloroflexota bacterium]